MKTADHIDCARDAQTIFSTACIKTTQAYFVYGKELLCKMAEKAQADKVQSRKAVKVRRCLDNQENSEQEAKGKAKKSAGRMPWHWEPKKDVINCDKPRGAVSTLRSVDVRMEQST